MGVLIRRHYYKSTLSKCGENLNVHYGAYIVYNDIEIGNRCTIEEYSIVSLCSIGDDVIIAARVSIMSGGHHHDIDDLNTKFIDSKSFIKKVILGNNLWIGTHAVIMNDVSSDTVVGASSVVTKKFPKSSVLLGTPAKLSRKRGKYND